MLGANVGTDLRTALERLHLVVEVVRLLRGDEQTLSVREQISIKVLLCAQLEFVCRQTEVEVRVLVEPAAEVAWCFSILVVVALLLLARLFRRIGVRIVRGWPRWNGAFIRRCLVVGL